ncbi:exonuclease domain-containing protein [Methylophaga sp. SB9B]|uniref:3'-5' exonuclease n=1 Tax=Methylophaga sp. SB9B TaxID=2570356 RepID=UPI0010A7B2C6|nr:3'-5' exonuclease [Methylophaga sp. SB9B]THK41189.1 exonuclease domain-containing protein [Methylophaga sp. SB9B]
MMLVVDLEATCWEDKVDGTDRRQTVDDMEVIEFGCVVCEINGTVIDSRSFFARPKLHSVLTEFCTKLTSIKQSDVDNAPHYVDVTKTLNEWLGQYELSQWVSWGNYDKNQLLKEYERHGVCPSFLDLPHENLKKRWSKGKKAFRNAGPKVALEYHGLEFEGKYHRAIDDALNIARLLPFIYNETVER